ncbi:hypothetical protein bcgnr5373_47480 [Bacillus cereus]
MRKGFIGILIAATCLILTGCFADMKVVEEDATEKLQDSKLSPYIEEASYKAGGKKNDKTSVSVYIKVEKGFSDLEKMEKYEVIKDAVTKLSGFSGPFECGDDNYCNYGNLHVSYNDDDYAMSIVNKDLIINDDEKYTEADYQSDMDQVKRVDSTEKYEESYNTVPSSSSGQGSTSTYDPRKDSANYDTKGNYKPVNEMTPEEIRKEAGEMLKEALERDGIK